MGGIGGSTEPSQLCEINRCRVYCVAIAGSHDRVGPADELSGSSGGTDTHAYSLGKMRAYSIDVGDRGEVDEGIVGVGPVSACDPVGIGGVVALDVVTCL